MFQNVILGLALAIPAGAESVEALETRYTCHSVGEEIVELDTAQEMAALFVHRTWMYARRIESPSSKLVIYQSVDYQNGWNFRYKSESGQAIEHIHVRSNTSAQHFEEFSCTPQNGTFRNGEF